MSDPNFYFDSEKAFKELKAKIENESSPDKQRIQHSPIYNIADCCTAISTTMRTRFTTSDVAWPYE